MVVVETRSIWIYHHCEAQPGKLSPNQARESAAGNLLFGKAQRRANQHIGISRRSLLHQPLRHRTRSQIRACEGDEVPAFAEAVQHVLLLFFGVAQIVKADYRALIEIDTCIGGCKLYRTDAGMDVDVKADESAHQSFESGRQARIAHTWNSQEFASPLRLADRHTRGLHVIVDVLKKDFLAGNAIADWQ